jgi:hypothetical protein
MDSLGVSSPASPFFFVKFYQILFLENSFIKKALDERIYFLYYGDEAKKKVAPRLFS